MVPSEQVFVRRTGSRFDAHAQSLQMKVSPIRTFVMLTELWSNDRLSVDIAYTGPQ